MHPKVTSSSQHLCDLVAEDLGDQSVGTVGLAEEGCADLAAPGEQVGDVEHAIVPVVVRRLEHGFALAVGDAQTDEVDVVQELGTCRRERSE